ncbi:MAG: HEAT repeat domain-containing protein, partial [Planctomycetota bacterium]|nr:HEAT repeat domain-containing protein [Planctomycetota bacterium]
MDDQPSMLKFFENLHSPDWLIRENAQEHLRTLGVQAVLLIDQMLQNTGTLSERAQLLEVLAQIGPESVAAWSSIIHELASSHGKLRQKALTILERIGPENEAAFPKILHLLHDEQASVRLAATRTLAAWGINTREAVPALAHALLDEDNGVRHGAAAALRSFGRESVPFLMRYFDDTAIKMQTQVAWSLGRMKTVAKEAIPKLVAALASRNTRLRKAAGQALGKIGIDACPDLAMTLKSSSLKAREEAADALGFMARDLGPHPQLKRCLPILIKLLENPSMRPFAARTLESFGSMAAFDLVKLISNDDAELQTLALDSLEHMKSQAFPALSQLIEALNTAQGPTHDRLADILGGFGLSALDKLLQALNSESIEVRKGVIRAFGSLASTTPQQSPFLERVLPKLIANLENPDLRDAVARSLGGIGKTAVPFLVEVLKRDDDTQGRYALWALAKIGPDAEFACPALIDILQGSKTTLQAQALEALAKIGPAAVPKLILCLEQPNSQDLGVRALERMGSRAVPALLLALQSDSNPSKAILAKIVASIARDDDEAPSEAIIEALQLCLEATDAQLRQAAVESVSCLADKQELLIPHLLPLLRDEDELVRRRAIAALVNMGRVAVSPLVATLAGDEVDVRREAAEALAQMGEAAVSGLCEALESETPEVRREAARTLGRIRRFGGSAESAVPNLIDVMKHDSTKCAAAFALGEIHGHLELTVPVLIGLLADNDTEVRWWATHALGSIARQSPKRDEIVVADAVLELAATLKDDDVELQKKAAWALAGIGPWSRLAIPELLKVALTGMDEAIFALRAAGAGDRDLVLPVAEFFDSRSLTLKKLDQELELNQGLRKDPKVLEKLRKGLDSEELEIRCLSIRALGFLGTDGLDLSDELLSSLSGHPLVASCSCWALEQLGRPVIPKLLAQFDASQESSTRAWLLRALEGISRSDRLRKGTVPASKEAVHFLSNDLASNTLNSFITQLAIRVLGVLGVEQSSLLPILTGALATPRLQRSATRALEELGPPALTPLFESLSNPSLRSGAERSLEGILSRVGLSKVLDQAMDALKHSNPHTRACAVRLIGKAVQDGASGAETKRLIPEILEVLKDAEANNRALATRVLAALGQNRERDKNSSIVPALEEALLDGDSEVRQSAGETLTKLAPIYHNALVELAQRPQDADTVIRQQSAWALGEIQERGSEVDALRAQASLFSLLEDNNARVRKAAVRSLSLAEGNAPLASALSQALKDQDFGARWEAVWAFWSIGPESVEELIQTLDDPEEMEQSINVLSEIGRAAVPELVDAIDSDELWPQVLRTLELIGKGAVPDLVKALASRSLRERAAEALGKIGLSAVPNLIEALKDPEIRQSAAEALGQMDEAAIPQLVEGLSHEHSGVRIGAARALGRLGPQATKDNQALCSSALCDALSDKHSRVRGVAARALGLMGPAIVSVKVVEALNRSLLINPDSIRAESATALGLICQVNPEQNVNRTTEFALPGLLKAIKGHHGGVRAAATGAIGCLGPLAITALSDIVQFEMGPPRHCAIEALEQIGRKLYQNREIEIDEFARNRVIQALLQALKVNSGPEVCQLTVESLGRLPGGLKTAEPPLLELLKNDDAALRKALILGFQSLDQHNEDSFKILACALKDTDAGIRALAASVLASAPGIGGTIVEELAYGLSDNLESVQVSCAEALGALGSLAQSARPKLLQTLENSEPKTQAACCLALAGIGLDKAKTLPTQLIRFLEADNPTVREAAAKALGRLGSAALPVAQQLVEALNDSNERVCLAVCKALGSVDSTGSLAPPALMALLKDSDRSRTIKAEALHALELTLRDAPAESRLALVESFAQGFEQSFDSRIRRSFVTALGSCTPLLDRRQCERVLDLITQWPLEELDHRSQAVFLKTIKRIGLASPNVVNALLEAMKSDIEVLEIKAAAAFQALEYQDPIDVERVLNALLAALSRPSASLRETVIESLGKLAVKFDREEIARDFINALDDPSLEVRHAALKALGQFGLASEDILEALILALEEPTLKLRLAAV